MDWIEKALGISPDGGSGGTEMMLLLGAILVGAIALVGARRFVATRRSK